MLRGDSGALGGGGGVPQVEGDAGGEQGWDQ
jgi:hypothetical protein